MEGYSIGAVSFRQRGPWRGKEETTVIGAQRVALLRQLYRREDLGEWEAFVWNPYRVVTGDDVNWATAGERVTS